ncbi:hypothetical protein [Thomasclavelia sp.]
MKNRTWKKAAACFLSAALTFSTFGAPLLSVHAEEQTESELNTDPDNALGTDGTELSDGTELPDESEIVDDTGIADGTAKLVQDVQAMIDKLPAVEEVQKMSPEEQQTIYMQVQDAYDAYEALSDEEQTQLTGIEIFDSLFDYFNSGITTMAEDPVQISNADELITFSRNVNSGQKTLNAVLTADIDMNGKTWRPIAADRNNTYQGTFDGQGHTIKNVSCNGSGSGIFSWCSGTIKNLGVTGNFSGNEYVAGICSTVTPGGNCVIENCWNDASITAREWCAAGILAVNYGNVTVRNCYNYGTINTPNGDDPGCGGIVGDGGTISNCFNYGTVNGNSGAIYGAGCNATNCYYKENSATRGTGGTSKTDAAIKSGEVTWLLNNGNPDGVWRQTLNGSDYPSFTGDKVYKWSDNTYHNTPEQQKAPTPTVTFGSVTASSITVTALSDTATYGSAIYSKNNTNWQASNVFTNLKAGQNYTIYAKYTGLGSYTESDVGSATKSTNAAAYTITIPAEATAGGGSVNIAVNTGKAFDLGYGGTVNVNVSSGINNGDGKLTLTRQSGEAKTITSVMYVGSSPFTDTSQNVAAFKSKTDNPVAISFNTPEASGTPGGIIPAGNYSGTVTFAINYSEP